MKFCEAFMLMIQGKSVSRKRYGPEIKYLFLNYNYSPPGIYMSLDGDVRVIWVPTQNDLHADDWYEVVDADGGSHG